MRALSSFDFPGWEPRNKTAAAVAERRAAVVKFVKVVKAGVLNGWDGYLPVLGDAFIPEPGAVDRTRYR